jgi:hypothetical protein
LLCFSCCTRLAISPKSISIFPFSTLQ